MSRMMVHATNMTISEEFAGWRLEPSVLFRLFFRDRRRKQLFYGVYEEVEASRLFHEKEEAGRLQARMTFHH